ncbi:MAG: isoleucine--tRNA ligase [bacterium]|nr:isoleucine--tRNA ligase [bacterium]
MADYRDSLNLPRTGFPMKANLAKREPETLQFWADMDIYHRTRKEREGKELYILHDGPPYANGLIHIGTALNKTLKDFVVKFRTLQGYDAPYVPGWDCHGQPIEHAVVKDIREKGEKVPPDEVRERCRAYADKYVEAQRDDFMRLGVFGDWYNPYLTLQPNYEATVLEVFRKMAADEQIYRGLRPVHWCSSCETALADAEVEYQELKSPSITIKFPVVKGLEEYREDGELYMLVWTTTPWTLPSNQACAVGPGFEYDIYDTDKGRFLLAALLAPVVFEQIGVEKYERVHRFTGDELGGNVVMRHPFADRESPLLCADLVTLEQGTGVVHVAPGHGAEDFFLGKEVGLRIMSPLDNRGRFTSEVPEYEGKQVFDADPLIVQMMRDEDILLHYEEDEHSYPHCWRCKSPLIFRATEQWFVDVGANELRERALQEVEKTEWVPYWGYDRIKGMLETRPDWCISRQRAWGVPIPALYCNDCGSPYYADEFLEKVVEAVREKGIEYWYTTPEEELGGGAECPECGGKKFTKSLDVVDVWFESGASHLAVLDSGVWPNHRWPSDMYLEGSDQHRGWFQLSLLVSLAMKEEAPYSTVVTHGWVLDEKGKAMHKSAGNVIPPQDIIDKYGADILRLWVASEDYRTDVKVSFDLIKQVSESYRRVRNTARFLLGNLGDFTPDKAVPREQLSEVDRYAYQRALRVMQRIYRAYERYEFHKAYHALHNFCTLDLSGFYLDIMKDRLYTSAPDDTLRRATQTVFYEILLHLTKAMAPLMPFTAEEIWQHLPEDARDADSIHLTTWEVPDAETDDDELESRFERFLSARDDILKALELAREKKVVGHPLDASVTVYAQGDWYEFLKSFEGNLTTYLIVSEAKLAEGDGPEDAVQGEIEELRISVEPAPGEKCPRCWVRSTEIGSNAKYPDLCPRCAGVMGEIG